MKLALAHDKKPERLTTAFAGNDVEAVAKARSYFTGFPPSSPQFAIIKDGKLAWMMERWQIEGRAPESIAAELVKVFDAIIGQAFNEHSRPIVTEGMLIH